MEELDSDELRPKIFIAMEDLDSDELGPMTVCNGWFFYTFFRKHLKCTWMVFIVFVWPLGPYTPNVITNGPL